jgi:hypothetical protein
LEHKIALHKAASEVRYVVVFNNGGTTEPNGVSELSLAPHRAHSAYALLSTLRLKEGSGARARSHATAHPLSLPDSRSQWRLSSEQDHQLGGAKKIERECCLPVTCQRTHKKTGRCAHYALFALKRANIPPFGLADGWWLITDHPAALLGLGLGLGLVSRKS